MNFSTSFLLFWEFCVYFPNDFQISLAVFFRLEGIPIFCLMFFIINSFFSSFLFCEIMRLVNIHFSHIYTYLYLNIPPLELLTILFQYQLNTSHIPLLLHVPSLRNTLLCIGILITTTTSEGKGRYNYPLFTNKKNKAKKI